jgi:hypothetical protein
MKVTAFLLASSIVAVSAAASDDVHAAKIALRGANFFEAAAQGELVAGQSCSSGCLNRVIIDPGKCNARSDPCADGTTCENCVGNCFNGASSVCVGDAAVTDNVEAEAQQQSVQST